MSTPRTPSAYQQAKGWVHRTRWNDQLTELRVKIPASVRAALDEICAPGNEAGWQSHRNAIESMIFYRHRNLQLELKQQAAALVSGQDLPRLKSPPRPRLTRTTPDNPLVLMRVSMPRHMLDKLDVLRAPGNPYGWKTRRDAVETMILFRHRQFRAKMAKEHEQLTKSGTDGPDSTGLPRHHGPAARRDQHGRARCRAQL